MTFPFELLRNALSQWGAEPQARDNALAGCAVIDEFALDRDDALLAVQCDISEPVLSSTTTGSRYLMSRLNELPADPH
ncbi:hypothetical protein [Kibdelosporangium phytohabitans]|nr:hypothetical protein [Kibdelosporangium phytohabitans]MBE1463792.1 hypothetical protein [Kibdelosporangium phytohabitans]